MSVPKVQALRALRARTYATASRSALTATARAKAEQISLEWKGTSATGDNTRNFIGGEFVESKTSDWVEVTDPVRRHCLLAVTSYPTSLIDRQHKQSLPECQRPQVRNLTRP